MSIRYRSEINKLTENFLIVDLIDCLENNRNIENIIFLVDSTSILVCNEDFIVFKKGRTHIMNDGKLISIFNNGLVKCVKIIYE